MADQNYKSGGNTPTPAPQKLSIDADAFQKALTEALSKGMAEGMAMASMAAKQALPVNPKLAALARKSEKCGECGQEVASCNKKHRQVAVYPKDSRWGRWFQGVFINGVRYLSDNGGHKITVPADSEVEYLVQQWERNEVEMVTGRERKHHSGTLGRGGQVNTNVPFFR